MPFDEINTAASPPGRFSRRDVSLPGWARFRAEIDCSLRHLQGTRVRVWLVALRVAPALEGAVAAALAPLGAFGRLPDGSLGFFYFGPLPKDAQGGNALIEGIGRRLRPVLTGGGNARPSLLAAAVQCWADELVGSDAMVQMLLGWGMPARPVEPAERVAA